MTTFINIFWVWFKEILSRFIFFFSNNCNQEKGLQFISLSGTGGDLHSVWPYFLSSFYHCLSVEQCTNTLPLKDCKLQGNDQVKSQSILLKADDTVLQTYFGQMGASDRGWLRGGYYSFFLCTRPVYSKQLTTKAFCFSLNIFSLDC